MTNYWERNVKQKELAQRAIEKLSKQSLYKMLDALIDNKEEESEKQFSNYRRWLFKR